MLEHATVIEIENRWMEKDSYNRIGTEFVPYHYLEGERSWNFD